MRGTHEGEFFGVPATGNKIAVQAMNFYYLADGHIVKERGLPDLLGVMISLTVRGCTAGGERCGQDCSDTVEVVMPTGGSLPSSMTSTHRSRAAIMYRRHSGAKGPARIHRRPGSGLNS